MSRLLFGQTQKTRRHRRDTERRSKVGRPDAAGENRGSAQGRTQPHHRVVADRDRFAERCTFPVERSSDRQRGRNDECAGRDARSEVNVVDLAQARERTVRGDSIGYGFLIRAELQQRAPFRRCAAGDPCPHGVRDVEPQRLARRRSASAGDMRAQLLEDRHAARPGFLRNSRVAAWSTERSSFSTTPYKSRAASFDTNSSTTSQRTRSVSRSSGSPQPPPPPVRTMTSEFALTGLWLPCIVRYALSPGARR